MISILTAAYIDTIEKNEWLNEMISSLQAQTLEDWELILMDDCSPYPITLAEPDERIRQYRIVNRSGPALCRNTAARLATFDCLLPVDADDVLPSTDVLSSMFAVWEVDKTATVYGDLQRYEKVEGHWRRGKTFNLPEYTFQKALDLGGIMPVTVMHSFDCHMKAGGWKPDLGAGLEDVEYWISAGKAGFCGRRLNDTVVLLYRKHEESRSSQLRTNKLESQMRNKIRELHKDVYEGRYPMGCCGGGRAYVPPETFNQSITSMPSTLDQFQPGDKVWVEYAGSRVGSFGVVGTFTNIAYNIDGPGHKLEVHVGDIPKFRQAGRGRDFVVGVAAPNGHKPQITNSNDPLAFVAEAPQVAMIEKM